MATAREGSIGPGALRPALAERIGIVVSSIVALYLLAPLLRVPEVVLPLQAFGSPLRLTVSRELAVVAVSGLLAWAGVQAVLTLHPEVRPGTRVYSHRLLPAMTAVAASVFWQRQQWNSVEGGLLVAAGIALALTLVILAQYTAMSGDTTWLVRLRTALGVVSLSVALYLLIMVYGTRARSLVTATAVAVIGFAVSLDVFQYEPAGEWRMLRASAVIGLVAGECSWALNYWRLDPLRAGFLLLIVVYVLVGLTRRRFQEALTRLTLIEHAFVVLLLVIVMRRLGV